MKHSVSGRLAWLLSVGAAALVCAALRKWQLSTAFEPDTGLATPGAQASVILVCVLAMAGAWLILLTQSRSPAPNHRWDTVFLGTGDPVFPGLELAAALLALLTVPVLFIVGVDQFQLYQMAREAGVQPPSNNGMLTLATGAMALLAAVGLFQIARDGLRPGRRGRGGFAAALPGVMGCVWLMESFRAHAANPVRWDYAPQLLAICLGMAFYMEFAGLSAGLPRPRRLLWLAGMTALFSAVALVSTAAELSVRKTAGGSLWCAEIGDALLLLSQILAAAGALWRLPPYLEDSARTQPDRSGGGLEDTSAEEETTDE